MPKACEMYSSYFLSDSSSKKFNEDCSSDSEGIGFHSLLDSTVFIYFRGDEKRQYLDLARAFQNCVGPYPEDSTVGTPGTHQFSEVMLFELLRLQECGIIEMRRDSLETLLLSAILQVKAKKQEMPGFGLGRLRGNQRSGRLSNRPRLLLPRGVFHGDSPRFENLTGHSRGESLGGKV